MRILVKFPTRERPKQFLKVIKLLNEKATDTHKINYLISIDHDDASMTQNVIDETMHIINIDFIRGNSNSKIHACNRDMHTNRGWDIVVLMSDDMIPQVEGWDDIIRSKMEKHFSNTDGALWFHDGYQDRICTLNIMGKKYYDRFNYLYHPDYHSLYCDNEFTEVARGLDKLQYFDTTIFKHEHFSNNSTTKRDALYDRNEALFNIDKQTFESRKAKGFQD